jgi:hypothetical protein
LEQQKVGFRPLISSAISAGAHTAPCRTAEQTCSLFQDTPKTMKIQSHSTNCRPGLTLAQPEQIRETDHIRREYAMLCHGPLNP